MTAIITSAFKTAVKGQVRMLMTIMKIRKAWVEGEGSCSVISNMNSAGWQTGDVV